MVATGEDSPTDPATLAHNLALLSFWLELFFFEMRTKHGKEYNPNTLHHLVCGILRHTRTVNPSVDFFKDHEFSGLRMTLDSEMKMNVNNSTS